MKYLKLHIFIWYILCFILTTIETLLYCIEWFIYFIWHFKNPFKDIELTWEFNHNYKNDSDLWYEISEENIKYKYSDKTPFNTFVRRCKFQINF